jgi:hypothetical protein
MNETAAKCLKHQSEVRRMLEQGEEDWLSSPNIR